jgi:pyrimidine-nucleoside phosphorylase
MSFVDVIARKRDGLALSPEAIDAFVHGATTGTVPDYQLSALLMAIVWRGMSAAETAVLTDAMVRSGARIDLSDLPGVKVGKHSTGGVGDKVSIALAPVAAACGVIVPKMSGRGLGHTGGTLDKLESIPGFRIDLDIDEFKAVLRDVGTCIIGQSAALVPADKALYALRDVTGTIESVPLIAASVMSKKLAEGGGAILLDVKCGDGAFMKSAADAEALARAMVAIGTHAGVRTEAFITEMDAPLGRSVGNALEIRECLDLLRGHGPADLTALVARLATRMVMLGGAQPDEAGARAAVDRAVDSGAALDVFQRMVERQGGNPRIVDDPSLLPQAPGVALVKATRAGVVRTIGAMGVGRASHVLGAGRSRVGDAVDHAVGVRLLVDRGERVGEGDPLAELHHRAGLHLDEAMELSRGAIVVDDGDPTAAGASRAASVRADRILGEVR